MKMKKLTALALAGVLCLGMSTTAFAAKSPTPIDADTATIVDEDGNETSVVLDVNDLGYYEEKKVESWKEDPNTLKEEVEAAAEAAEITLKKDATYAVVEAYDYSLPVGVTLEEGETITIDFDINEIKNIEKSLENGDVLYLMHGVKDEFGNTNWVLVETEIVTDKDGKLYARATLDSLSPIAFVLASDGTPVVNPDPVIPTPNPEDPTDPSINGNGSITADQLADLIVKKLQQNTDVTKVVRTASSGKASPKTGE